jgi:hypothetical protein
LFVFFKTRTHQILAAPSFTIEGFLLSALARFDPVDEETKEKKEDTVKRYVELLRKEKLASEKTLSLLTEERLQKLGMPMGHAAVGMH